MPSPSLLIVRFSAIGDCVMAAWASTSLRQSYPESKIVWAVETRCHEVIETGKIADEIQVFPRDAWKRHRWSPATWREQLAKYAGLRRHRFEFGFDLQGHSKTALCLRIAGPKQRIAARATDSLAKRLNPTMPPSSTPVHTVEWNHETVCSLCPCKVVLNPNMPNVGGVRDKVATLSVSAGSPLKAYPATSWDRVAFALIEDGWEVRCLGGSTDKPISQGTDLVGKLSLGETMREVATSAIHLAADTGTSHMAAAYGVPVVTIFGPTDPVVYRPYNDNSVVLRRSKDPADVAPEEVLEAARSLMDRGYAVSY